MIIAPNVTDITLYYKLVNPATGVPETGLVITNLDLTYVRDRSAAVKADLTALGAVTSAHGDNQAIEIDAANAPGLYRVDVADAAFAAGVERVQLIVNGAAIDPAVIEVELAPWVTLLTGGTLVSNIVAALMAISPFNLAMVSQDLELYRGDTWVQPITGLGNLTGYTKMWITAREDRADTDAQTTFQVLISDPPVATDGLQYIASARATTPGNAAITVTDLAGGAVSVRIEATETARLGVTSKLRWDYQWTDGTDVQTRRRGDLFDISDVTRATS